MTHEPHPEWTPEDAEKTENIIKRAKKTTIARNFSTIVYWVLLFVAIIGNLILSVVLVPFLLILKGIALYSTLLVIGLSFGFMFNFILHSIEDLKQKQHIVASIFIPAIAIINVGVMAVLANKLIMLMGLTTPTHSPALVGASYVFGYVCPSIIGHFIKKPKVLG